MFCKHLLRDVIFFKGVLVEESYHTSLLYKIPFFSPVRYHFLDIIHEIAPNIFSFLVAIQIKHTNIYLSPSKQTVILMYVSVKSP